MKSDRSEERYDSRPETKAHIERVRDFGRLVVQNLERRFRDHDLSKLESPEVEAFDIATPKLATLEYGSPEYKESLAGLGEALKHHYEHNDHHAEHHKHGVSGMSLLSLLEMLCDWRAASERTKQRADPPDRVASFESGLAYNFERFGIEPQLQQVLVNTVRELEM